MKLKQIIFNYFATFSKKLYHRIAKNEICMKIYNYAEISSCVRLCKNNLTCFTNFEQSMKIS